MKIRNNSFQTSERTQIPKTQNHFLLGGGAGLEDLVLATLARTLLPAPGGIGATGALGVLPAFFGVACTSEAFSSSTGSGGALG